MFDGMNARDRHFSVNPLLTSHSREEKIEGRGIGVAHLEERFGERSFLLFLIHLESGCKWTEVTAF